MRERETKSKYSTEKQIAINLFFSVVAFALNLCISFFVTPYITRQFGAEAYGFVKLADDFTGYAALLFTALNSMASRFIMLEKERGNSEQAQKYFSSITLANVVLSAIMTVPSAICVGYLECFLEIPPELVAEVKLTFAVTFAVFIMNFLFATYGNCYYLTNKLSIGSIRESLVTILRATCVITLFIFTKPRISYLAICTFISMVFSNGYNCFFTRKLTPEFRFRIADFEWKKLWEVLSAGIWNSISRLSQIFTTGLDLLLTNTMVSSLMMGYLSIAKSIPLLVLNFCSAIGNVFVPNQMILYARNDMETLKRAIKNATRIMCLIMSIPNAILITMGEAFFQLWVPEAPARLINTLAVLSIISTCVTGPAQTICPIFTITNRIKENSIVSIVQGFVGLLISYTCLRFTDWGVFAIVCVSLTGTVIVTLVYHVPYAAKYIGLPKHTFFPEIGISLVANAIVCAVGFGVRWVVPVASSWVMWFSGACLTGILGLAINTVLFFSKEERSALLQTVMTRIKKT